MGSLELGDATDQSLPQTEPAPQWDSMGMGLGMGIEGAWNTAALLFETRIAGSGRRRRTRRQAEGGSLRGAGAFEKTHVGRAEKEREWSGKTERADGARWRVRVRMGTRRERNDPRATEQQLQRSAEGVDRSTVEGGEMSARADGLLVG